MSIVVDACTISIVFNSNNSSHVDFKPVKDWLESKKGFLVIGGTKYKKELKKMGSYLQRIVELKKAKKIEVVSVDDQAVDSWEEKIKVQMKNLDGCSDCDDHHLIALLAQSGCCLMCSADKRSFRFIKNKIFYPPNTERTRIYTSAKLIPLLDRWKCKKEEIKNVV